MALELSGKKMAFLVTQESVEASAEGVHQAAGARLGGAHT
jgi:hypothetical protein